MLVFMKMEKLNDGAGRASVKVYYWEDFEKKYPFSSPKFSNITILVSAFNSLLCANVGVTQALNPELCFLGLPALGKKGYWIL